MGESRTSKSIKNAQVSLIYYFIQLILGFFSRKVFFDYLGSEILGLNTTASNLLGFLNLAELGVGMSVGYFLYQPLYNKDTIRINKIISLQGWIYRRIAYVIIAGACILMCFFPIIFAKSPLSLWYSYATFGVLLFSAMLGYFVNYKQILLQADQKNYKVQRIMQGAIVVKTIFQIVLMPIVPSPFVYWLIMELVFAIIGATVLNRVMKKEYPWLSTSEYDGHRLLKEMPEIMKKTKQVFIHKICSVILSQCTPLVMYAYSTLTIVAFYGNYQLIVGKVGYLLQMIFSSTGAGIGDLIASKNEKRIRSVFWELLDSRLFFSCSAMLTIYITVQPFIAVWLGEEYVLSERFLIFVIISSTIFINQSTIYSYLGGYGLYGDIWAAGIETVMNLGLSLLFGYYMGFEGVLLGTIISQILIPCIWKPYYLFSRGIKLNPLKYYFLPLLYRLWIIIVDFIIIKYLFARINTSFIHGYITWGIYTLIVYITITTSMAIEFYLTTQGMRNFTKRLAVIVIAKIKK